MLPVIGTDPIRFNLSRGDTAGSLLNHQNPRAEESSLNCTDCSNLAEHPSITLYPITGRLFTFLIKPKGNLLSLQLSLIGCFDDSSSWSNLAGHRFYLQRLLNYLLHLAEPRLGPPLLLFHQRKHQPNQMAISAGKCSTTILILLKLIQLHFLVMWVLTIKFKFFSILG